jgi:hypothetical protein
MLRAVLWFLCAYLVLKLLQYFFVPRAGFGKAEQSSREKLLRGEPLLLIVACVMSVPAALWSTWGLENGYARDLERSADCYGRLRALTHLGKIETSFDALRVLKTIQFQERSVSRAARSLELAPAEASKLMADRLDFYTRRYTALSRQGDRREIRAQAAEIERCIHGQFVR